MAKAVPKELVDAVLVEHRSGTRWRRESAARVASQVVGGRSGQSRKGHGWRRTAEDEQLLEFATLHGMILFRQAAKWIWGGRESTAAQRVTKMVQAGLLNRDDGVPEWAGVVLTPTKAGQQVGVAHLPEMFQRLAGRDLSVPDNLLHSALVADRMLVERSRGYTVLSERQIRLLDREDPESVRAYLESDLVGGKYAVGEFDPGIRPGRVWRVDRAGGGVLNPDQVVVGAAYPGLNQSDDTDEPCSVRYPDFVIVHPRTGELIAVEIEAATKSNGRLASIVRGYSKAVARLVPDGFGGYRMQTLTRTDPATGEQVQRQTPVLRRHQFRQVRWMCVPETANLLRGRFSAAANRMRPGYIAQAMPAEYASVNWRNQSPELPMIVDDLTADDQGVQYALDQRIVHARYRCSYKRWRLWRQLWEQSVAPERRGLLPFSRWLMVPAGGGELANFDKCLRAEQEAANTAPPRRARL